MWVMYFMILAIPCVRYIQGMFNPRCWGVPCRMGRGILLQNPAAWRPILNRGVVISVQSCLVRESAGAGYLSVLRIVVLMERSAFWVEMWLVRILSVYCRTFCLRYCFCLWWEPSGARYTPSVSFASDGGMDWSVLISWFAFFTLNCRSMYDNCAGLLLPFSSHICVWLDTASFS